MVTNHYTATKQLSKTRPGAVSAAVALAVVLVLGVVAAQSVQAQTYRLLYSFTGGTDGNGPNGKLVRDAKGNLYGATFGGGDLSCQPTAGCGVVFKLDPTGALTVLHRFTGKDGADPNGGMERDRSNNLYGTTTTSSRYCNGGHGGCGVVFKIDRKGRETILYRFSGGAEGLDPNPGIIRDAAGNLYGTTNEGGKEGYGTVFKLDSTGKHTVLYAFTGGSDGGKPDAGLVRDRIGNLYGATVIGGGTGCDGSGCGTVFKLDTMGKLKVLYTFKGRRDGGDGYDSYGSLIRDSAGTLYGTVPFGGDKTCDCGVVFKVDKNGKETVLHRFTGKVDGESPFFGLVRDKAGNLYGTTAYGGEGGCEPPGCGTAFKLDTAGKLTTLYSFTGGSDQAFPEDLVRDAGGNLYGVTGAYNSHNNEYGTVFEISP
jgi:uncharacterized repeat protein (TIGR03803 family)